MNEQENIDTAELRACLRLQLAELSPRQREASGSRVVTLVGRVDALAPEEASGVGELCSLGLARRDAEALAQVGAAEVDAELLRVERAGFHCVTRFHESYPPLLGQIPDPPWLLWVRGRLPDARVSIAVVGPRRPTAYGIVMTTSIVRELAALGTCIISGGARGVDATAHRLALEEGAPTVAVLGCGIDVSYPPEHRGLFGRIAEAGALVSEFPCGTRPLRHHFPIRNRILAGWAPLTLVTEATLKSGTLITARLALDCGREVLAVPGPVTSLTSEGTNELIARGARLTRSAADVLAELPEEALRELLTVQPGLASVGSSPVVEDEPVLLALPVGRSRSLEDLASHTGLGVSELLGRLVLLEAEGRVRALEGGVWVGLPGRLDKV